MEVALPQNWSFDFDGAKVAVNWDRDPNGELFYTLREEGDIVGLRFLYWELMEKMLNGVAPDADVPQGVVENPLLVFYRRRYAYWDHKFFNP